MRTTVTQWATKAAGAGAIALLLATPAFAQSRGDWNRNNNDRNGQQNTQRDNGNQTYSNNGQGSYQRDKGNRSNDNNSYRENQRINATGKVTSFSHERDGYRVQLDRGRDSYWVPSSYFRGRGHDIRVGISVVFGGVYRGNGIYVDDVNYPDGGYYNNGYYNQGLVRGVIQGIDYRAGTAWLRDDVSGRSITVDLRRVNERRLRRGEYVELSGSWDRGGLFDAYRVERVR